MPQLILLTLPVYLYSNNTLMMKYTLQRHVGATLLIIVKETIKIKPNQYFST